MNRSDFEIMAPVGSWESLYAAHQCGEDRPVYLRDVGHPVVVGGLRGDHR